MNVVFIILAIWLGLGLVSFIVDYIREPGFQSDDIKAFFLFLALGPIVLYIEIAEILEERKN